MAAKRTLTGLLRESARKYANWTFMMERHAEGYVGATFKEVEREAEAIAGFFLSREIEKGDRIALLSEGRNSWVSTEFGILLSGAISVPISIKIKTREELLFRLKHSGSRFIVVSEGQLTKVLPLLNELPDAEAVVLMDTLPEGVSFKGSGVKVYQWKEVIESGERFIRENPKAIGEREEGIDENDPATLTYTSGTTAEPKGIVLSHKNYWVNVSDVNEVFRIPIPFYTLLILPWDHSFAHTAGIYSFLKKGSVVAAVEPGKTEIGTLRNIPKNIREVRPTYLLVVPALVESFRRSIESKIEESGSLAKLLFRVTVTMGTRLIGNGFKKATDPLSLLLWPVYIPLRGIISKQLKASLGGRIRFMVSGGSGVSDDHVKWFTALGLPIYQGYGLSETSPVISCNTFEKGEFKIGSSGKPFPWAKVRIVDEEGNPLPAGSTGEITVKGDCVMIGYWRNEKATREAIVDGWFHTGDLGYLDEDGFLFITGRIKSLLVGEDGEKYSPEALEQHLVDHIPFISQVMLYNQQNPYTVALIVPDREKMKKWAEERGFPAEGDETVERIIDSIADSLKKYREDKRLSQRFMPQWVPKTFAILPESFNEENGMINSTLKMVRRRIVSAYRETIDALYGENENPKNDSNRTNLKGWLKEEDRSKE